MINQSLTSHLVTTLYVISFIGWGLHVRVKYRGTSIKKCLFSPNAIISDVVSPPPQTAALLMVYLGIMILQSLLMLLTGYAFLTYIVFFAVIMIFELFLLLRINQLVLGKRLPFIPVLVPISLVIIAAAVHSILTESTQIINIIDFWTLILKFLLCFLFMTIIIIKNLVDRFLEAFFIIVGFALLFISQMFDSGFKFMDYLSGWDFAQISGILVLSYWLWSILWIRKLTSQ